MQNFAFDVPVIDASTGRDISLSREEYYRKTQASAFCMLVMFNAAGAILVWLLNYYQRLTNQQL